MPQSVELLQRRITRERNARKQAENILEEKSLALFDSNQKLLNLASELERKIEERTKDLKLAKRKAEKAQKAEKEFMASMSHEIRTPLNAIIGMTHLLNDTSLSEQQKDFVNVLLSSSNILLKLISNVLDFSKIDAGKIETNISSFNIKDLVNNILVTFQQKAKLKNIFIDCSIDKNISNSLKGDELLLNQILINLIGNAEKFTANGSIFVNLKLLSTSTKYQNILIEVKDTGVGISKKEAKIIFKAFKQANKKIATNFGGTGLGLKISQKIAKHLGSEIKVKSKLGIGATFYFTLKLKKSKKNNLTIANNNYNSHIIFSESDFKLLVVEDNPTNQKYISTILKKWNLNFTIANNGFEAIEKCNSKKYDLILMDIEMPGINGFETCKKLKISKLNNKTKVIALTASSTKTIKKKAIENGMQGFLLKPFTPTQLKSTLSQYLIGDKKNDVQEINKLSKLKSLKKILLKTYENDIDFAIDIFNKYLSEMDSKIEELQKILQEKNIENFKKIAHEITPSFQMVGLNNLSNHTIAISKSNENNLDQLQNNLKEILNAYKKSKPQIAENMQLLHKMK